MYVHRNVHGWAGRVRNPTFNETSVKDVFAARAMAMAEGLKACAGSGMQLGSEKTAEALQAYEEKY